MRVEGSGVRVWGVTEEVEAREGGQGFRHHPRFGVIGERVAAVREREG